MDDKVGVCVCGGGYIKERWKQRNTQVSYRSKLDKLSFIELSVPEDYFEEKSENSFLLKC